jgi:hypothetical protein
MTAIVVGAGGNRAIRMRKRYLARATRHRKRQRVA